MTANRPLKSQAAVHDQLAAAARGSAGPAAGAGATPLLVVGRAAPAAAVTGTARAWPPRPPLDAVGAALLADARVGALLVQTAQRFPHVINQIADAWARPDAMRLVFDELLLTDRVDRQGFPLAVALELTELREHYERRVAPALALRRSRAGTAAAGATGATGAPPAGTRSRSAGPAGRAARGFWAGLFRRRRAA